MLEVLTTHSELRNLSPTLDYMTRDEQRLPTRFERRGRRLGHCVRDLAFVRISTSRCLEIESTTHTIDDELHRQGAQHNAQQSIGHISSSDT